MRKIALGLMATAMLAAPALAQTPLTFADVDSNADGRLSYEELILVWPDLTQEEFAAADTEGTGLTPDQLGALQPPAVSAPGAMAPLPAETPSDTAPASSIMSN